MCSVVSGIMITMIRSLGQCLSRIGAVVLAVTLIPFVLGAQGVDVIRGLITSPDNLPIENASVTATSALGGVNRIARTDRSGRFTITVPGADGDYFVLVTALGYAPRRFEIKRTVDQDILIADARLARVAMLDTVHAAAERSRISRRDPVSDIGGTEQAAIDAALASSQQGDLNALAATIPGILTVYGAEGDPSGFSVLGLSADQNQITLNGSLFGNTHVPRDALLSAALVTAPYDVSRGGFSGGQLDLHSASGSNFVRRSMSLNLDFPQLQWTDATGRTLGQQYSTVSLGGGASGPIVMDRIYYSMSYQLGRRANSLATLLNTNSSALQAVGVAADSIARLITIAQNLSIPVAVAGGTPASRNADDGSVFGTLNYTPINSPGGQTFYSTVNASWNGRSPVGLLTGELPSHSGTQTSFTGGAQFGHTAYVKNVLLTESRVSVNASHSYGTPYALLPSGNVLINSVFADGTAGIDAIALGGSSTLGANGTSYTAGYANQLSWMSVDNRHRIKLSSELRRDGMEQGQSLNTLGTFTFNSLADLQAGAPANFIRTFAPRTIGASDLVGAIALGDSYRHSDNLQVQYGLRADANRFLNRPAYNADVQSTYGMRNDAVPNHFYLSPRLGFSWAYGEAPQIATFDGAVRGPRAIVRGGIGVFQNTPQPALIGGALGNTGLTTGQQQLICVGAATPKPQWAQYATNVGAIPVQCANGLGGSAFVNDAPNVTLFSDAYEERRSIRGNLQWSGLALDNRFNVTVDAMYSRNQHQSSFVDLNFTPTVRFTLGNEGNRPVFVSSESIVPASGSIAARDASVDQFYNHVAELRSDLESRSRQLRLSIAPLVLGSNLVWNVSYVLAENREQTRGFSSTAGDPASIEWARSQFDVRHQITYGLSYDAWDAVRIVWTGRILSGIPFTPSVSADVNGDGYANDRAFIFDPATVQDAHVADGIRQLLATGSASAKDCLRRQLGALTGRNSCQGPWTASANLSISFNPVKVGMPKRATVSLGVSNPLGAADLLTHGSGDLHGWGQAFFVDPTLLFVRGFDPATRRYRYDVNPRFGGASPQLQSFRQPVTVTMQIRLDVGPTRERQQLTHMLDIGRSREGSRMPEQFIRQRYANGDVINPMGEMLRQSELLELTGEQADSLAGMTRAFAVATDSTWSVVARYLAGLPDRYDRGVAYEHYKSARESTVDLLIDFAPKINAMLTAEQKRKLSPLLLLYLDGRYLRRIRSGAQGAAAAGAFPDATEGPKGAVPTIAP
ncbi:MAG: hypothetical protein JWM95_1064 [Gemmatimonadetes bacterium]|nr:hypothetical protein [Gemmatimonadota bacterium]